MRGLPNPWGRGRGAGRRMIGAFAPGLSPAKGGFCRCDTLSAFHPGEVAEWLKAAPC